MWQEEGTVMCHKCICTLTVCWTLPANRIAPDRPSIVIRSQRMHVHYDSALPVFVMRKCAKSNNICKLSSLKAKKIKERLRLKANPTIFEWQYPRMWREDILVIPIGPNNQMLPERASNNMRKREGIERTKEASVVHVRIWNRRMSD